MSEERRPNIVLFMPDQLRADAVGAFGNPVARTPNMDALAGRGTVFAQAYAQHSVCSPSRVSIFTGWYPHVAGHRTLTHLIKPWEPNLFRLFKDGGYTVALAGMRGDDFAAGVVDSFADLYGYEVKPTMVYQPSPYPPESKWASVFYSGKRNSDGPALDLDEAATRTAEAWLAAGIPEPWILFIPLTFPHPPFEVEEPWFSQHDRKAMPKPVRASLDDKPRYMREIAALYGTDRLSDDDWAEVVATYYGMISRVDDQLGRVLRAVERAGVAERTVTALFTDHGEYMGDYGLIEKWSSGLHDCLLRNPLIIAAPGRKQGNRSESLVEMVDLLPTLLELAGIEAKHTHFGRSLVPLLDDGSLPHRDAVFSEGGFMPDESKLLEKKVPASYRNKIALQTEQPELLGKAVCIRTERWTYVHRLFEDDELYDRVADPQETVNLVRELPDVQRELRDRLLDWSIATADAIPWEPDSRFDPRLFQVFLGDRPARQEKG